MRYVIGIDEVGRGCLAGPVVVAAALVPLHGAIKHPRLGDLRDSKKLLPKQREDWLRLFREHDHIKFAIGKVEPRGIEKLNIANAANKAAFLAYKKLLRSLELSSSGQSLIADGHRIYLDGGLYLGKNKKFKNAQTVINGDELIPAIQVASIVAKVYRDRLMARLAKKHPWYGFEIHKGYGTKKHLIAIKKYGRSPAHRLTFLPA